MNEDVRQKVLDGAVKLFMQNGIKGVTMDEIAESLNMSKRTIYENFNDKNNLLLECLKYVHNNTKEQFKAINARCSNFYERMLERNRWVMLSQRKTCVQFFRDVQLISPLKEYFDEIEQEKLITMQLDFKQAIEEGLVRPEFSPEVLAGIFKTTVDSVGRYLWDENKDFFSIEDVNKVIMIFYRGMATEKGLEIINGVVRKFSRLDPAKP